MTISIGDVLCTRNNSGLPAFMIRLGAALMDKPNTVNHVVIAHHKDKAGTLWGIEGRPGGVGWVDCKKYLSGPYTISNAEQPKSQQQRYQIQEVVEAALGTPYDWKGIALDAMDVIGVQDLWFMKENRWSKNTPPAQVVCSSLADYVYDRVGLASPGKKFDRRVTPGDWAKFITEKGWK